MNKDMIGPWVDGQRDCREGIGQRSNDPDYIRGYEFQQGVQYALEQSQTALHEIHINSLMNTYNKL